MVKGGMCGMQPPPRDMASQCAGRTHPTGMHSCLDEISYHSVADRGGGTG